MTKTSYTLSALAELFDLAYIGDPQTEVWGVASLKSAKQGQLSFLDNPKYSRYLAATRASIVIIPVSERDNCQTAALLADHPYYIYARVAECFVPQVPIVRGIHDSAVIGQYCELHDSVSVGAQVVLGDRVRLAEGVRLGPGCVVGDDVVIDSDTVLHANVSIYAGVQIGKRVIIHSGAVLGSDGFGIAKFQGKWHKVPQLGSLRIGNDVEVGANTTIDRGALEDTVIGDDVKLDNQIQIAHNVKIGAHTAIAGCVGIAGSSVIGRDCLLAGGVGVAGHLQVTDNVAITGLSGVTKSIDKPGVYSGMPAQIDKTWKRSQAHIRQLDKMANKIKQLEQQLNQLANKGNDGNG